MCGICGYITTQQQDGLSFIHAMNAAMHHRGPNHAGVFSYNQVFLGQARLSIIDLSDSAHQPMLSNCGNYCIVFNGEIYNFQQLKKTLLQSFPSVIFNTQSDTEVLLVAYQCWGVAMLSKLEGMFSFAIFDKIKNEVFIARDRFGVKPFYYVHNANYFAFASETRPLIQSKLSQGKLNKIQLATYVQYQTVYDPYTIVADIKSLPSGCFAILKNNEFVINKYYDPKIYAKTTINDNANQIYERVNYLLSNAVEKRLVSDVPIGVFLSGGIDSSAIVGLMRKATNKNIYTFSVTFDEAQFSEEKYANIVSKHFNTVHQNIRLNATDFLTQLPNAVNAMDHPSGDGVNTYMVSKATREAGLTVALSGVGSDELFYGYNFYKQLHKVHQQAFLFNNSQFIRKSTASALTYFTNDKYSKISSLLSLNQIHLSNSFSLWRQLFSEKKLKSIVSQNKLYHLSVEEFGDNKFASSLTIAEINSYLKHILLRDADQQSMASSLEVREPFLDHELINYVLQIPDNYKIGNTPKPLLINSLQGLLPGEIVHREKMGFTLPWSTWMRSTLKSYCMDSLQELKNIPELNFTVIHKMTNDFMNGSQNINWTQLWHLVVLSQWIKQNKITS